MFMRLLLGARVFFYINCYKGTLRELLRSCIHSYINAVGSKRDGKVIKVHTIVYIVGYITKQILT